MRFSAIVAIVALLEFGAAAVIQPANVAFSRAQGVANVSYASEVQLSSVAIDNNSPLLVCVVSIEPRASSITVTSVSFGDGVGDGQQLRQLGNYYSALDGLKWSTWYLVAPFITFGSVSVHLSEPALTSFVACDSYTGVDQSNPFGPVTTISGASGEASLTVQPDRARSLPWAHLFSSNSGFSISDGGVNRQETTPHGGFAFSALVDAGAPSGRNAHTFRWNHSGEFGGQASVIHRAKH